MSRRLFEQSENTSPSTNQRIAFGRAGQPTENMSIANLISFFQTRLSFMWRSLNGADIPSKADFRTNLGVYSSSQTDVLLNNKANIYPTIGGALKSNNTTSFTPTTDYHPATKKYVDDNADLPLFSGYTNLGDLPSGDATVIFGTTLSTSSYIIIGELYDLSTNHNIRDIIWGTSAHTSTSFRINTRTVISDGTYNLRYYFKIYAASSFTSCSNSPI
jgi:hypothetical protein